MCYSINRKRRKVKARIKAIQKAHPQSDRLLALKSRLVALELEAQEKILNFNHCEERRALEAMKTNSKYFYSYAKHKNDCKTKIGPLRDPESTEDVFYDDPKSMADILQNQFVSVFSDPDNPAVKHPHIESH